ncbi:FliM/FliN family flagellar motor switch protein [Roseibacterium sp. SDUM158017]|uniref:flagellar motor switch protein FliM n=1 Tax=Roseicyclus salinarum TaxID=3036773 RepID=UPI0024156F36|nr:flagellar motor switch protein FliM [Roseibacterium sp. SDUM158017]MDG4648125.1 FliM/FliN family flagellar motor switch protein [Roseibacterium sp. SDUM158017]
MLETPDLAPRPKGGGLARIVAAHLRGARAARERSPELSHAWVRTLRHAAVPFKGLHLVPGEVSVGEEVGLTHALGHLPEHGLVAVLEDRDGRRGLVALSHGLVDALIEVQTTGRVDAKGLAPRRVTRIDEALCRDFLDLMLAAFSKETEGIGNRDWPERLTYGSVFPDRAQLNLLLPERAYHLLSAEVTLGAAEGRRGQVALAVPLVAPEAGEGDAARPAAWRDGLEAALQDAAMTLDAVLCRTTRSLQEVRSMAPGDLVFFDPSALAAVTLETPEGRRVASGRLGQMNGRRALKIAGPSGRGKTIDMAGAAVPGLPGVAAGLPDPDGHWPEPGADAMPGDPLPAAAFPADPFPADPLSADPLSADHGAGVTDLPGVPDFAPAPAFDPGAVPPLPGALPDLPGGPGALPLDLDLPGLSGDL